jgi:hypothetical protein
MDMYKSLQSFAAKLQSLTPRLALIVIDGISIPLAINKAIAFLKIGPISENVMTLAITAFSALGYLIAELVLQELQIKR